MVVKLLLPPEDAFDQRIHFVQWLVRVDLPNRLLHLPSYRAGDPQEPSPVPGAHPKQRLTAYRGRGKKPPLRLCG
eukprot:865437-Rhodomonas_salina.1